MKISINLNESVDVELTEHGKRIAREHVLEIFKGTKYRKAEKDAEAMANQTRWTMHELMNVFGPYLSVGMETPFVKSEIVIVDIWKKL